MHALINIIRLILFMPKEQSVQHKRQIYIPHSLSKRAIYSLSMVLGVMIVGTVGLHYIEGYSYIDAFYFMSMIATAEGPTLTPAFVSVGTVLFAVGFIFGPFFGSLLKLGEVELKKEEHVISKDIRKMEKRL